VSDRFDPISIAEVRQRWMSQEAMEYVLQRWIDQLTEKRDGLDVLIAMASKQLSIESITRVAEKLGVADEWKNSLSPRTDPETVTAHGEVNSAGGGL
jgi:hypothetical protein